MHCTFSYLHMHLCLLHRWPQIVSTMANMGLTDIAARAAHPCMLFQLYVIKDREVVARWVRQAEAAGYKALVVTVDAQRLGRREADERNRWAQAGSVVCRSCAAAATTSGTKLSKAAQPQWPVPTQ